MMRKARSMMGVLLGAALVLGSVGPAQARPRYGHGGYHDRHWNRDRGGFGFGDAVGVAALVGAAAIVASSLSKDRKAAQDRYPREDRADADLPPPLDGTDYGADVESPRADDRARDDDFGDRKDDQITNACADAARQEASSNGGYAEIRRMDAPLTIDGGYNIDGEVETHAAYRDSAGTTRRFTCTVKDGRVADVYLSRDMVSR